MLQKLRLQTTLVTSVRTYAAPYVSFFVLIFFLKFLSV
jgi:hypothetical protein